MKTVFTLFFCFFIYLTVNALTWETTNSGAWNTNAIWKGGVAPAYTTSDTIVIKHYIFLNADAVLNNGALLKIENPGGLCGHHQMTVNTGAALLKYGILELDVLLVSGGIVNLNMPGDVILTSYVQLSNGGLLYSNGCSLAVGPWFQCRGEWYDGVEEFQNTISVYPNPSNGIFSVHNTINNSTLLLKDVTGKIIYQKLILNDLESIDVSQFPDGIYFWQISTEENAAIASGKIQVVK